MSDDAIPEGVCTAPNCKCECFKPDNDRDRPMYCAKKNCSHSVEWHHVNAKELRVR